MREGIHPEYHEVEARCACGNSFTTKSTAREISVEVCSKCHPFYTDKQRYVDTGGRIGKFKRRLEHSKEA